MPSDFTLAPDYTFETTKEYKTLVSEFENGVEQRRQKWSAQRRSWKLVYRNRSSSDLSTINTLFDNKKGMATSFTWDNPIDSTTYTVRFKADSLSYSTDYYGLYNIEFELIEVK
jgi:uncharacterized protein (TIGR02217 family)